MTEQQRGRVQVEADVVFGTGGGRELKCTVYHPPQEGSKRPAVVLVHGGGWVNGDRTQLHGYGILMGRLGYVCIAPEYRLAGEATWPAQIHDVKAALRWVRANAARLGVDPDNVVVEGNSAGGHLALMAAGTPNEAEFEGEGGNTGVATNVAACVAVYAPTFLYRPRHGDVDPRLDYLFGRGVTLDVAKKASPIEHVAKDFPPTLIITGNKDVVVPVEQNLAMYNRLVEAGASVELHVYADAPHAFDSAPEFGRQAAAVMALFLDRYVTNPRSFAEVSEATGVAAATAAAGS